MKRTSILTKEFLSRILRYDPATGLLYWKYREDRANNWNARFAGCIAGSYDHHSGYTKITIEGQSFEAHLVCWVIHHGKLPVHQIDHRNRTGSDNRMRNLRDATPTVNCANRTYSRPNKTGFPGVRVRTETGRYFGSFRFNRKWFYTTVFDQPETAYNALQELKKRAYSVETH